MTLKNHGKKPGHLLVTGADGALGGAVVESVLASDPDSKLSLVGRTMDSTPLNFRENSLVRTFAANLGVPGGAAEVVRAAEAGQGPIEAWIHCAGGFRWSLLENTSDADIEFLVQANYLSAVYLMRALIPGMKARNFGRIALVSARSSQAGGSGVSVYTGTKAALNLLAQSVAEETRTFDITINAVLPTIIDTPANRRDMPDADFSKWVPREELAAILVRLVSPEMAQIHGALLAVAGRL
jgi:NAD(P)-dependent dehydrogenase (short-subunit alcohol dehydrogenase family)